MKADVNYLFTRRWQYIGPGEGRGIVHRVIQVDVDLDEIITWSVPVGIIKPGWSWLGARADFYNQFAVLPQLP